MGAIPLIRSEKLKPRLVWSRDSSIDEALAQEYRELSRESRRRIPQRPRRLRPRFDKSLILLLPALLLGVLAGMFLPHPAGDNSITAVEGSGDQPREAVEKTDRNIDQLGLVVGKLIEVVKLHDRVLSSGDDGFSGIQPALIREDDRNEIERLGEKAQIVTVAAPKVTLRAGPGVENSAVMVVSEGVKLLVEMKQDGWLRVLAPSGERAWVRRDLVE